MTIATAADMAKYILEVEKMTDDDIPKESWTGPLIKGGPDVTLYSSEMMIGDSTIIERRYKQTLVGGLNEIGMFAVLILKCKDASGHRMFKFAHYESLKDKIDVGTVVVIFNTLFLEQFKRMGLIVNSDDDDEVDPHEVRVGN